MAERVRFLGGGRFPIAATAENLRGEDVMKMPEFAESIASGQGFSVNICNGLGELTMTKTPAGWMQRVTSVDKVFGIIRGKPRAVRI